MITQLTHIAKNMENYPSNMTNEKRAKEILQNIREWTTISDKDLTRYIEGELRISELNGELKQLKKRNEK